MFADFDKLFWILIDIHKNSGQIQMLENAATSRNLDDFLRKSEFTDDDKKVIFWSTDGGFCRTQVKSGYLVESSLGVLTAGELAREAIKGAWFNTSIPDGTSDWIVFLRIFLRSNVRSSQIVLKYSALAVYLKNTWHYVLQQPTYPPFPKFNIRQLFANFDDFLRILRFWHMLAFSGFWQI